MAEASASLHEPEDRLSPEVIDRHRAIVSLMEELEAADWYDQRAAATGDAELREIIAHNRDEEKEHAMMLLEWLRRNDPGFAEQIEVYIKADGPVVKAEEAATGGEGASGAQSGGSLGIGSLKGKETP